MKVSFACLSVNRNDATFTWTEPGCAKNKTLLGKQHHEQTADFLFPAFSTLCYFAKNETNQGRYLAKNLNHKYMKELI